MKNYKEQINLVKRSVISDIAKAINDASLEGKEQLEINIDPKEGPNRVCIQLYLQQPMNCIITAFRKTDNEAVGGMDMTVGEWIKDLENQEVEHVIEFARQLGIE